MSISKMWLAVTILALSGCSYFSGIPVCGEVERVLSRPFIQADSTSVASGMTTIVFTDNRVLQLKGLPPGSDIIEGKAYTFYVGPVDEVHMDIPVLQELNGLYFEEKRAMKSTEICPTRGDDS